MSMKDFIDTLNDEQKAALLAALTNKDSTPEPQDEPQEIKEDFTMRRKNTVKNNSRREKVQSQGNMWQDTGEDRHIDTPQINRTPRTRSKPAQKSVRCHVCGKEQKINASLVYGEYYRCDRCVGR